MTFIVLCCIVLALAIHSAYFIKRFSLLTAMMSNKLLGLGSVTTFYKAYTLRIHVAVSVCTVACYMLPKVEHVQLSATCIQIVLHVARYKIL